MNGGPLDPWPAPDPVRGAPLGKHDIADRLGVAPVAIDVWIHRTAAGRKHPPFPPPAGYGKRPPRWADERVANRSTPYWWEDTIIAYVKEAKTTPNPTRGTKK